MSSRNFLGRVRVRYLHFAMPGLFDISDHLHFLHPDLHLVWIDMQSVCSRHLLEWSLLQYLHIALSELLFSDGVHILYRLL